MHEVKEGSMHELGGRLDKKTTHQALSYMMDILTYLSNMSALNKLLSLTNLFTFVV